MGISFEGTCIEHSKMAAVVLKPRPRCCMYGIFANFWAIFEVNIHEYSVDGAFGIVTLESTLLRTPPLFFSNNPSGYLNSSATLRDLPTRWCPQLPQSLLVDVAPNYSYFITINPTCNLSRSSTYLENTINIGTWWFISLKWFGSPQF